MTKYSPVQLCYAKRGDPIVLTAAILVMIQAPGRLCSAVRHLAAGGASSLLSSVKRTEVLQKRSELPAPLWCHTVCADCVSMKPARGTPATVSAGSPGTRTVCSSMASSTSRLYSSLPHTLSRTPLSEPEELGDRDALLRDCEEALQRRPARLRRSFVFPKGHAPSKYQQPIRVMQWNILAQALGEGQDNFIHCSADALNWAERKYLILEEILTYEPDILCLQEVDHYYDTFSPVLASLGYYCTFQPKPCSPCLEVDGNNGPDGCALFVRHSRFLLEESMSLQLAPATLFSNQVAIVQKLRCRDTDQQLCVAVTHLKARSGWEQLRCAQGSDLLRILEQATEGTHIPLLVCGDFNAEPSEDVYRQFATSGLGLDSACKLLSADSQSEPPYTTWKIRPSGESCHTLDYIWYSRGTLRVDAVLDFPTEEQIGPNRLPSYNYPSDHLSLVCDISFHEEPDRLQ
ncbi:nocturnin-like isoform X1 [Arapaima gigas]